VNNLTKEKKTEWIIATASRSAPLKSRPKDIVKEKDETDG